MPRQRKVKIIAADFETTSYEGQSFTEVWSAACAELYTDDVHIFHSIEEQFDYFLSLKENLIIYYHNLKFDGSFWLDFLEYKTKFVQGFSAEYKKLKLSEQPNKSYTYTISTLGQWYSIMIKNGKNIIEIRDSYKLLPFSLEEIGKSFGTKHKKLEMEYKGYRYAGCEISEDEKEYIKNDIYVLKEALEIMYDEGHTKLTIGACCLSEYFNSISKIDKLSWYGERNLTDYPLQESFGTDNADAYIRKAYKGGWCYLVKGKENKVYKNGITADVNSLYPSMMYSESGNRYPVGEPEFWQGNMIPKEAENKYYFIRIKTRFKLKKGYLPFIQLKGNYLYKSTECLETSDIYNPKDGRYYSEYYNLCGELVQARPEITLTCTDYKLFLEHYNVMDFEILDGCYFDTEIGIFDTYINKYKKIKMESRGAKRELAKLFLNNLYGKMAASTNSSYKIAIPKDNSISFLTVLENDKKPGYIPVGAAITSYARNFTIRAAQKNYYGNDKPGFIYADTDSIHCDLPPDKINGITIHDTNFCCWKLESFWDEAIFAGQKRYIEHVTHSNEEKLEKPYYNIKCAGMPKESKKLFEISLLNDIETAKTIKSTESKRFIYDENGNIIHREITDFKKGLCIPGKLLPKRIPGGIILKETTYEFR